MWAAGIKGQGSGDIGPVLALSEPTFCLGIQVPQLQAVELGLTACMRFGIEDSNSAVLATGRKQLWQEAQASEEHSLCCGVLTRVLSAPPHTSRYPRLQQQIICLS